VAAITCFPGSRAFYTHMKRKSIKACQRLYNGNVYTKNGLHNSNVYTQFKILLGIAFYLSIMQMDKAFCFVGNLPLT